MTEIEAGLIAHNILTRQHEELASPDPVSEPAKLAEMYLSSGPASIKSWGSIIDELHFGLRMHEAYSHGEYLMRGSVIGRTCAPFTIERDEELLPSVCSDPLWGSYEDWNSEYELPSRKIYIYYGYRNEPVFQLIENGNEIADEKGNINTVVSGQGLVWRLGDRRVTAHKKVQPWHELIETQMPAEKLAINLLKQLGTSPTQDNVLDLTELTAKKLAHFLPAVGLLLQWRAVTIYNNKVFRNRRGTYLLRSGELKAKMLERNRTKGTKTAAVGVVASILAAVAGISLFYTDLWDRAKSKFNLGKQDDESNNKADSIKVQQTGEESNRKVNNNPNYHAFLNDLPELQREYRSCVVAYHGGKRIAVSEEIDDLLNKIPEEYRNRHLFIEYLPQRSITIRPPLRLLASR